MGNTPRDPRLSLRNPLAQYNRRALEPRTEATRRGLSKRVGTLVDSFETIVYAIAFLLLVAAAVLVVIGIAAAIFMIRYSARHTSQTHDDA